jgi:hypothetical protein
VLHVARLQFLSMSAPMVSATQCGIDSENGNRIRRTKQPAYLVDEREKGEREIRIETICDWGGGGG